MKKNHLLSYIENEGIMALCLHIDFIQLTVWLLPNTPLPFLLQKLSLRLTWLPAIRDL